MITNDDRMGALRKASETIVDAYGSLETANLLGPIRKKYQLDGDIFINLVGDTILGLIERSSIETNLINKLSLTSETAHVIAIELKPLFDKISNNPIPQSALEARDRLELRPEVVAPADTVRPLTHEELMNALSARRTMASDIEAVRQKREVPPSATPTPPPSTSEGR